jgi:hypothetical protein
LEGTYNFSTSIPVPYFYEASTPGEDSYPRSEFSSTPNGTIEEIPIVVLKNLGVESSYPNPDRCEEQVQCADSDIMICVTQQCDGTNDCPLADDEENCLYKKGNEKTRSANQSYGSICVLGKFVRNMIGRLAFGHKIWLCFL